MDPKIKMATTKKEDRPINKSLDFFRFIVSSYPKKKPLKPNPG